MTASAAAPRAGSRGQRIELGGAWLSEGHTAMYERVAELGLDTFWPGSSRA